MRTVLRGCLVSVLCAGHMLFADVPFANAELNITLKVPVHVNNMMQEATALHIICNILASPCSGPGCLVGSTAKYIKIENGSVNGVYDMNVVVNSSHDPGAAQNYRCTMKLAINCDWSKQVNQCANGVDPSNAPSAYNWANYDTEQPFTLQVMGSLYPGGTNVDAASDFAPASSADSD